MENIFVEFLPPWIETGLQPAFYDKESGTALQQTARMYARVNMLIRMFNKLSKNTKTTVEDYINKFNELHDYVHDYFDNLDVQEEINNKLDQMVEDGVLQEIIATYLNSKAVFGFDTVSDMAQSTNLINGSYARTLGYYSINDGGGGLYKIRNVTNDDINNPFVIEMADDNLVAELVHYKTINLLQLGVKSDGTADISVLTNSLLPNYDIYLPQGEYLVSNPINITRDNTIFKCEGTITIDDNVGINVNASSCNIEVDTISNGEYEGTAIQFKATSPSQYSLNYNDTTIHNIYKVNKGFSLVPEYKGVQYSKFNFDIIDANICIYMNTGNDNTDESSGWVAENTFTGGRCKGTTGIKTEKGPHQDSDFSNNKFYNIAFEEIVNPIILEQCKQNVFLNYRMLESITGTYHIQVNNTCMSNKFSGTMYLFLSKISDQNTSLYQPNIYEPVRNANGNIATSCRFINGSPVINGSMWEPDAMTNIYNEDTFAYTADAYYNGMLISIGVDSNKTSVVTLPNVFGDSGVHDFYLRVSYRGTDASITINDSGGNAIVNNNDISSDTANPLSNYYFRVFKLNTSLNITGSTNNKWIVQRIK